MVAGAFSGIEREGERGVAREKREGARERDREERERERREASAFDGTLFDGGLPLDGGRSRSRKVDVRLPGEGIPNSLGARPVHLGLFLRICLCAYGCPK